MHVVERKLHALISSIPKRRVATWIREFQPLLWGLRVAIRLFAPRQCVGAVGAVINNSGQVLLVEHVFRTDFPWGLPGGWVEIGESPAETVQREIEEELKFSIEVRQLLVSEPVRVARNSAHPRHLGLAFYCRPAKGEPTVSHEILSIEWADPLDIRKELAPFQRKAALLAKRAFDLDFKGPRPE